jgi:tripartite-type tricarboxylate transporter receptor subunit TctC
MCLAAAGLAMAVLASACSSGQAADAKSSAACGDPVNPLPGADLSFYCGKTITVVIDDVAGSQNDLLLEAMKSDVQKYLGAKLKPVFYPGSNVTGMNTTATASPDGLTVGEVAISSIVQSVWSGQDPFKFSPAKLSWVQVSPGYEFMFVACAGSPYRTMDAVIHATKPVTAVALSTDISWHLVFPAYNVPNRLITGYTGSTQGPGCERGDGDIAYGPPTDFTNAAQTALDPGLTPLLVNKPLPANSSLNFLNKVPDFQSFFASQPVTSADAKARIALLEGFFGQDGMHGGIAGPPGIPTARLKALQSAFGWAAQQPDVDKAWENLGIPTAYVNPDKAAGWVTEYLGKLSQVQEYMKSS